MGPSDLARRLRQDAILVCGLALALLTAFHPTLQAVVLQLRDIERSASVAIVPPLVVLLAAVLLHQASRRRAEALRAAVHASEAASARARAGELEAVLSLGHGIAESLDLLALRQAVERHLPAVGALRDAWLWLRLGERTELLRLRPRGGGASELSPAEAEAIAIEALSARPGAEGPARGPAPRAVRGYACFPLRAAGADAGVLAVSLETGPLSAGEQRMLSVAAATIAIGARNVDLVGQIREHGLRDALTGCVNRAHGLESLHVELRRAERLGSPLSVLMLDLDHFKQVNDTHGHLAGDAVLAAVGALVRASLRGSDVKVRYGGEEFLVVLPDTPPAGARQLAETLRGLIDRARIPVGHTELRVTASIGVTTAAAGEQVEAVIARADRALYDAKRAGRDRVCVAEAPPVVAGPPEARRQRDTRRASGA